MSPENKKGNHQIQLKKIITCKRKMVQRTYYKVLSAVVNELLHFFFVVFTQHVSPQKALLGFAHVQEP
jgi:hypothetical protein